MRNTSKWSEKNNSFINLHKSANSTGYSLKTPQRDKSPIRKPIKILSNPNDETDN